MTYTPEVGKPTPATANLAHLSPETLEAICIDIKEVNSGLIDKFGLTPAQSSLLTTCAVDLGQAVIETFDVTDSGRHSGVGTSRNKDSFAGLFSSRRIRDFTTGQFSDWLGDESTRATFEERLLLSGQIPTGVSIANQTVDQFLLATELRRKNGTSDHADELETAFSKVVNIAEIVREEAGLAKSAHYLGARAVENIAADEIDEAGLTGMFAQLSVPGSGVTLLASEMSGMLEIVEKETTMTKVGPKAIELLTVVHTHGAKLASQVLESMLKDGTANRLNGAELTRALQNAAVTSRDLYPLTSEATFPANREKHSVNNAAEWLNNHALIVAGQNVDDETAPDLQLPSQFFKFDEVATSILTILQECAFANRGGHISMNPETADTFRRYVTAMQTAAMR